MAQWAPSFPTHSHCVQFLGFNARKRERDIAKASFGLHLLFSLCVPVDVTNTFLQGCWKVHFLYDPTVPIP